VLRVEPTKTERRSTVAIAPYWLAWSSDWTVQKKVELDDTDWQILEALQRDGRCSFRDLALQIALSPPAAAERVRRLEADGVIVGYQAVLDPVMLGHEIEAIVHISRIGSAMSHVAG
jgi:uncharacterized membrane protein